MDRDQLVYRVRLATTRTVEFSRRFVWNELPDECRYLLIPAREPLELEEVMAFLWQEGKIPEWINLTVDSADEACTYIEVKCCGRFTDQDHQLYYQTSDTSPIQVCGPSLPPGWQAENPEWQTGNYHKFDLHWLHRQRQ